MRRANILTTIALVGACAPMHVGEPCQAGHCVQGAECAAVQRDLDRCVALCDDPFGACAGGEVCYPLGYGDGRLGCYPGGDTAIGAPCTYPTECVRGAYCFFGTDVTSGVCGRACGLAGGCALAREPCRADPDCASNFCVCTIRDCTTGAPGACTEPCTLATGAVSGRCASGAACAAFAAEGVTECLPGGTTPVGAACVTLAECVLGALCIDAGSSPICRQACDTDADCPAHVTCSGGIC